MTKNKALGKPPHECGDGVCENGYSCREEHYKTALIEAAEQLEDWCEKGSIKWHIARKMRISAGVKEVDE